MAQAISTDLYQLTMAYGYWKNRRHDREAVFHLFFRNNPFQSGFSVAGGLAPAIDYLREFHFDESDIEYLRSLNGSDGKSLFEDEFLRYLHDLKLNVDVDAIPEGTLVFPHEPIVRVRGSLLQCQLLETALLNIVNFDTLIATKAARVCLAARDASVIELGLRRAQGENGGLAASRAAYLGGCSGTSNVLAGKTFGIPVRGTHAHSWVMSFDDEREAFAAYAKAMPGNALFLVDTYDSLEGVRHAVEAGLRLRREGLEMMGIRLDSGDLAWLSIEARKILDESGFPAAKIVASNDLDEYIIASLVEQGARIDVYGVGTRLITAYDQPALGGVYKLGAIRDAGGAWQPRIKVSEQTIKTSNPGILQVRRYTIDGQYRGDAIYDTESGEPSGAVVDPADPARRTRFGIDTAHHDLLVPVFRGGELVYEQPSLERSRDHARRELSRISESIKRLANPHRYPAGLDVRLHEKKNELILAARGANV